MRELKDKNRVGVFSWIGKSVQGMVLRSFFVNSHESLRQLYGTMGEQFILTNTEFSVNQNILALMEDIRDTHRNVLFSLLRKFPP